MPDFKITKEQKAYLDSLVCQRISEDEANKQVIEIFSNPESSPGITNELKTGWNRDKQDKLAFYIIKDPKDNQPLMFFSLKCGEMHKPLIPEGLSNAVQSALMLLKVAASDNRPIIFLHGSNFREQMYIWRESMQIMQLARSVEVEPWAEDVIEKQLEDGELPEKVWEKLWVRAFRALNKQDSYDREMRLGGENIIRTKKSFPAVELVHFCAHKKAQDDWQKLGMSRSLGKNMFWYFVEPIIREIRDLVGCEYLYLFAADGNKYGRLTKYYKELGFDFRDDINVTKPAYDFCCYFMCQDVTELRTRRNAFFREYNNPVDPHKI